jgi:ATP-dependent RNA helicase DBP3
MNAQDGGPRASTSVKQLVTVLSDPRSKDRELLTLLRRLNTKERVIVFCLYKKEASRVEQTLQRNGYPCVALHGDMSQADRTRSFESFRLGQSRLLVATDVAARGVDIPDVEHVINYTFPLTIEDYGHRIGRTGRGFRTGTSHTFFTELDKAHAGALVGVMRAAGQEVPKEMFQFSLTTKRKVDPMYGEFGPKPELAGRTATRKVFQADDD